MSEGYLHTHCQLVTTDLDQAREQVGRLWERHSSVLRRGRTYGLRWHHIRLRRTTLSYIHSASAVDLRCGTRSPVFRFSMAEEGFTRYHIDGHWADSTPRHGVIYAAGQELELHIEPFRSLLLGIDGSFVADAAIRRFSDRPTPLWPKAVTLARPPASTLRALCRWMGGELDRPETPLLSSPLVAASVERSLLTLFLDCLTLGSEEEETRARDLAPAQLRQIEEWLDVHFAEPIGVEDLAAVCGVGVRSVQSMFRRMRGCTPSEAIVGRRLRHARDRLSRAGPDTTVAAVARDSGFFHLGRFAARYARMFGENPSQTLACGPRLDPPYGEAAIHEAKGWNIPRNG